MKAIISSEWLKLRRKGMALALGAAIAVTVLGTVITVLTAGGNATDRGGIGGRTTISIQQLTSSHGFGAALGNASELLGIVTLGVVAASVAGEFSSGTLRNLLVREPRRIRLLGGKLLGLGAEIVLAVVVSIIASLVGGSLASVASGHSVGAWFSAAGIGAASGASAEFIAAMLGWGALGAILAIAFRSPVVAVVVGVVYALPLEGILGNISSSVARWLPGKMLSSIAAGGNSTASLTAAVITAAIYLNFALSACFYVFTRRDVAS